jgi:hypothetical protein
MLCAVTQNTTACFSVKVVDIIFTHGYCFVNIISLEVIQ